MAVIPAFEKFEARLSSRLAWTVIVSSRPLELHCKTNLKKQLPPKSTNNKNNHHPKIAFYSKTESVYNNATIHLGDS